MGGGRGGRGGGGGRGGRLDGHILVATFAGGNVHLHLFNFKRVSLVTGVNTRLHQYTANGVKPKPFVSK